MCLGGLVHYASSLVLHEMLPSWCPPSLTHFQRSARGRQPIRALIRFHAVEKIDLLKWFFKVTIGWHLATFGSGLVRMSTER